MAVSKVRLKRIEKGVMKADPTAAFYQRMREGVERWLVECAEWLVRHAPDDTPDELLQTVYRHMTDSDGWHIDTLCSWQSGPFARWAMPMPSDYRFPPAILTFVADPPAGYIFGHACESCGLSVPICTSWDGKTGPRPDPSPFPTCPACGGKTSYAANWQTGPRADPGERAGGEQAS